MFSILHTQKEQLYYVCNQYTILNLFKSV